MPKARTAEEQPVGELVTILHDPENGYYLLTLWQNLSKRIPKRSIDHTRHNIELKPGQFIKARMTLTPMLEDEADEKE